MKHVKRALVALCAAALCLAFVGCAGASQSETAAFAGTWNLVEMSDDDGVTGSDELSLMNSLGMDVTLTLDVDGTAMLDTLGRQREGTWSASSETEGTVKLDNQDISIAIEEGKLSMVQGGDTLVFEKIAEAPSASAESASSQSGSAASNASASASSQASSAASSAAASGSASSASASAGSSAASNAK